ncbi:hypothetical protein [Shimia aestuarii]|nr:hypothetical protein [Shimia aestuarii]
MPGRALKHRAHRVGHIIDIRVMLDQYARDEHGQARAQKRA